MCGRYTIKDLKAMAAVYGVAVAALEKVGSRFNACPSQLMPVIHPGGGELMKWGLVPFWEKSEKPKIAPINARSEEALSKPMFRQALQKRRCLVLADGFFEWRRLDERTKFPFHIQLRGGRPFAMAGIYEEATDVRPATFAMLTTRPNELMVPIHDRMPVILSREGEERWLAEGALTAEVLGELATPYPAGEMEAFAVSRLVNSPKNDAPECVLRIDDPMPAPGGGPNSA